MAAADADVIVVVTAWPEFAQVDAGEVAGVVGGRVIVDACQGISVTAWRAAGWQVSSLTVLRARQWKDDAAAVAA